MSCPLKLLGAGIAGESVLAASDHSTHLTMVGSCSSLWERSYKELSYKFAFF